MRLEKNNRFSTGEYFFLAARSWCTRFVSIHMVDFVDFDIPGQTGDPNASCGCVFVLLDNSLGSSNDCLHFFENSIFSCLSTFCRHFWESKKITVFLIFFWKFGFYLWQIIICGATARASAVIVGAFESRRYKLSFEIFLLKKSECVDELRSIFLNRSQGEISRIHIKIRGQIVLPSQLRQVGLCGYYNILGRLWARLLSPACAAPSQRTCLDRSIFWSVVLGPPKHAIWCFWPKFWEVYPKSWFWRSRETNLRVNADATSVCDSC